ncbi:insulinase family protein [Ideonella azotifigens]|uniref:Insulinase family protein n=2 Tax=Ideonella azotifigens TaxID=513160 RepID=A0ABP3VJA2_9BURK|nr:pitrilysin family protein [Ideonella azotifigens]MCD2344052.1 insulinase family protein [Ideonella azotifigens]
MLLQTSRRAWLARAALLAAAGALPAWVVAAAPATTPAALAVAPMKFKRRTLANGLEVIAEPGGTGGSVSVQVWYRVGGKDDPVGRSGFAHLFEHLMFKSTRYMKSEQFDRLTEDVGGQNNAFTAEDVTAYFATVPSHHLERILWAEAERMVNLNVDEANFKSERAVVEEEFRQRVLANPYGRLFEAMAPNAFIDHPYKRPVIGSIEDLESASLDDVRAFHSTFYRPDNAVLIVTGDFDGAQLDQWVDRYFGPLKKPDTPIPRVNVKEPVRTQSRQVALTGPNVPLPAAVLIWQAPNAADKDAAAFQVIQGLLAGGESSRLNESLVYRQRIAQSAGMEPMLHTDAGAVAVYAIASGQRQPQSLVAPLHAELARLAKGPIPAAELDKVKTQLLTAALNGRQTSLGRGTSIGWAMIHDKDPEAVNRELTELQAVTAADVQRVLRQYVIGKPAVTLFYTQEAK